MNSRRSIKKPQQKLKIKILGWLELKESLTGRNIVYVSLDLKISVGIFSQWFKIEMNDQSKLDQISVDLNAANLRF